MDTGFINVSAVSSANQWAGYDAALQALYEPYLKRDFQRTQSVNLVDWMWPSRHRGHEIGCCIDMLREIGITVNTVISGGISIQEIEKSMTAGVNAVVCSSVMGGNAGQAGQKGITLAGQRAPCGFSGTREWLSSIAQTLGMEVKSAIDGIRHDLINLELPFDVGAGIFALVRYDRGKFFFMGNGRL